MWRSRIVHKRNIFVGVAYTYSTFLSQNLHFKTNVLLIDDKSLQGINNGGTVILH